jgi:predicted nucleotidyltransferase
MNAAQLGGMARARSLSKGRRAEIAREAARSRWSRRDSGILDLSEIRRQVARMLADRDAVAYLFGSYARGEARENSDVDLLVVEKKLDKPRIHETYLLRSRLTWPKDVDLMVVDAENFEKWRTSPGTVQNEVDREGVRLV